MLMPKRTKYRKVQRGRMKGVATRGNKVCLRSSGASRLWNPAGLPAIRSKQPVSL